MTKYGRPSVGRPGVEHLGDVRVVHQGQGLPLRLEPGQDLPRVHPRLDQLDGHLPADRLGLLGHQTAPIPPSPICSSSLYGPIDRAGPLAPRRGRLAGGRGRVAPRRTPGTRRPGSWSASRSSTSPPQGGVARRTPGRGTPGGRPAGRSPGRRGRSVLRAVGLGTHTASRVSLTHHSARGVRGPPNNPTRGSLRWCRRPALYAPRHPHPCGQAPLGGWPRSDEPVQHVVGERRQLGRGVEQAGDIGHARS